MDPIDFDAVTRTLTGTPTRRRALRVFLGAACGGWLTAQTHSAAAKKRRKRKKRKDRDQETATPLPSDASPPSSPPGCPSGQKPCDGGCIPSSQCCDNGDCPISGQTCSASRQCACPPALPDICGGACLASCLDPNEFLRNPDTCGCCVRNMLPSGGDVRNCCSGRENDLGGTSFCWGRQPGESCSFPEQCFH